MGIRRLEPGALGRSDWNLWQFGACWGKGSTLYVQGRWMEIQNSGQGDAAYRRLAQTHTRAGSTVQGTVRGSAELGCRGSLGRDCRAPSFWTEGLITQANKLNSQLQKWQFIKQMSCDFLILKWCIQYENTVTKRQVHSNKRHYFLYQLKTQNMKMFSIKAQTFTSFVQMSQIIHKIQDIRMLFFTYFHKKMKKCCFLICWFCVL